MNTNPFNAICEHCKLKLAVHRFKGRKAVCEDGFSDGFKLWQVIDAKRALGHTISKAQSHSALMSKIKDSK